MADDFPPETLREIDAAVAELRDAYPEMADMEPHESVPASVIARLLRVRDLVAPCAS